MPSRCLHGERESLELIYLYSIYFLSMTRLQRLRAKRAEVLRIATKHGAENIRIFGSVVRGDDQPQSDIDLLVSVGQKTSAFFPGGLVAELEALLGCPVDVVTEKGLHWFIRDRVLHEATPL